ncbi:MAG: hypothetical protein ABH951_02890 [Patescibacteria group bacterium]
MAKQIELCKLVDERGNLTEDGKFLVELALKCTNIVVGFNGKESEWDRMMRDPEQKAKLEKAFGQKLESEKKQEKCPKCGSNNLKPSLYAYTRVECEDCGHHIND